MATWIVLFLTNRPESFNLQTQTNCLLRLFLHHYMNMLKYIIEELELKVKANVDDLQ